MQKARLAFVSLVLGTALSILHCSSSDVKPPLQGVDKDDSGTPTTKPDSATTLPDGAPVPADAGPPDTNPGVANLVISTNTVDFQQVPCNTQASPKLVTLTN